MDIKEKLLAAGGRIWDKKGHRIYLSRIIGKFADIDYYKTGNLHSFAINGERWSNCQGYKLLAAVDRAYYDCDADRFVGLGDYEGTVVNAIENTEIKGGITMKKYVLTDPCYLINDDAAWRRYCDLVFDEKGYMNVDNGAAFIAEQLGTPVQVAGTGYGDWANSLDCVKGPNRLVNDGCFCADAGMVCFCELTPQVERAIRDLGPGAYAEIEAEDPVCEFDCTNRDWTRVKITDGASVYMSEECEFYDEDDY